MNAETFCQEFESSGCKARSIVEVLSHWESEKQSRIAEDYLGFELFVAELLADAGIGDGLLDQISPELLKAFAQRRGADLDNYDEVRAYLKEVLAHGDQSVAGVVNQVKGQLGELEFVRQSGGHAYLASSTNQEAWDVALKHILGPTEYVQIKMYQSPDKAVEAMLEVQRKVAAGTITDHGDVVHHINFAVNKDIASAVQEKAALHSQLAGMEVYGVHMTNAQATGIVADGFANVGPCELAHMFGEWLGGTVSAACLYAMANAFLVHKGSKSAAAGIEGAVLSTAISGPAIAAAHGTAWWAAGSKIALISGHPVLAAIASGMVTRAFAKKWYETRESTSAVLAQEACHTSQLALSLGRI